MSNFLTRYRENLTDAGIVVALFVGMPTAANLMIGMVGL